MAEIQSFRRVLIVADESADWMVAGLRQLDRLALSIDEFALENRETAPVLVCIFWRPDLDALQRWVPTHDRLTRVAFTTGLDGEPFDLVLNTRLFLYRKAIRQLLSEGRASARPITSQPPSLEIEDVRKHVPPGEEDLWQSHFRSVELVQHFREGTWEYITDGNQIDEIEIRFLRGSGKSQDGLVSRYLNRPISRVMTRLLLRFPTTPNAWTLLIFPIPIVASLILAHGTYWSFLWGLGLFQVFSILDGCDGEIARAKFLESERGRRLDDLFDIFSNILLHGTYWPFLWGLVLFQVFSILDGCDGEIARAKFLESERGRRLDDLFDIFSNILLAVGLGFGLMRQTNLAGHSGWFYLLEGGLAAALIGVNEFFLATRKPAEDEGKLQSLGGALYPRHRELVERSGLLLLGEKAAFWLIQLTKRDVAVLFFVFLTAIGEPAWILHLLLGVTAISLALALRARRGSLL